MPPTILPRQHQWFTIKPYQQAGINNLQQEASSIDQASTNSTHKVQSKSDSIYQLDYFSKVTAYWEYS